MIDSKKANIGVFICHCGDNISRNVDIDLLKTSLKRDGLSCIEDHPYLCSEDGQQLILEQTKLNGLDGIVIAACSPEIHLQKFRDYAEIAGLNRYKVDIANIREQCAWTSKDDATPRALDIIKSSVYAMENSESLKNIQVPVVNSVLVIGGGISGMTSALSLAKQNIKVYLIEKSPTIGGNMAKIGKVYSSETMSEECAMCSLAPLMGEVLEHPNIELLTLSTVTLITGHAGDFKITTSTGPVLVDPDLCTSCGECTRICQIDMKDEWNANLSTHKAIYKPFPQALPRSYTINTPVCIKCGACVETCVSNAINLENEISEKIINVGAIIIATGHIELDPTQLAEFNYHKHPDVITQMELARILAVNGPTSGKLVLPSNNNKPQRIVMIQCVGSRDRKPGSITHCSTICCMVALKHTNYITNHFKDVEVYICYTDIRTPGTYENYYFETQKKGEKNVRFIRGKVAEVKKDDGKLIVRVEDTLSEGLMEIETDLVVLSCAVKPSDGTSELESIFGVSLTEDEFIQEKHPKLEPTQTTAPGIFVCGTAQRAMDITDSINISRSAASKVMELINSDAIEIEPNYAVIDYEKCNECGICKDICTNNAIHNNQGIKVDPIACKGDGGCISQCPQNAIHLLGSSDDEIYARIRGCLSSGEKIIVAFLDEKIAYIAADNMGINRTNYPNEVRIIKIPSIMRLELKHLLYAFENGAIGVFISDGLGNVSGGHDKDRIRVKVDELKIGLKYNDIDPDKIWFYEAYLPHYKGMASNLKEFSEQLKQASKNCA